MLKKNEIYALVGALAVILGVMYYSFVFNNKSSQLETARENKQAAITEYNKVMDELSTLDERKGNIKELTAGIEGKTEKLYPEIIQEKIITEIDDLMKKSDFKGDISFNPIEVVNLEDLTPQVEKLPDTSFATYASAANSYIDNHSSKSKNKSDEDSSNNEDNNTSNEETTSSTNSSDSSTSDGSVITNDSSSEYANDSTCEHLQVSINFTEVNYKQLKDFKKALEAYNRKISCQSVTTTYEGGNISGVIVLEFYGVPKVGNYDNNYFKWDYSNVYGKDELFGEGAATGAYGVSVEEATEKERTNDFVGMVKSSSSIQPTLTFGRANDEYCSTYIYDDSSNVIDVTLTLTEKDGKYYYKYSGGNSRYPATTMGNGEEFTPCADVIKVNIESEARDGSTDKSGIKLKVINNTDKKVEVAINNDDADKPRVTLESEGGSVYKK
jgi:type IV pilus assembly protein PilO